MEIIKTENLVFDYIRRDEEGNVEGITTAVDNVNLEVMPGDFIAVLGHNGSGKSTLAKHFNAILMPTEGTVWALGNPAESRYGVSESGQPDHRTGRGGGRWFRTGKYGRSDEGDLGESRGEPEGGGDV